LDKAPNKKAQIFDKIKSASKQGAFFKPFAETY